MSERVSASELQEFCARTEKLDADDVVGLLGHRCALDLRDALAELAALRVNPTPSQAIAAVEKMREKWASEGRAQGRQGSWSLSDQIVAADKILTKLRTLPQPEPDEVSEAEVEAFMLNVAKQLGIIVVGDKKYSGCEAVFKGVKIKPALKAARAAKRGAQ